MKSNRGYLEFYYQGVRKKIRYNYEEYDDGVPRIYIEDVKGFKHGFSYEGGKWIQDVHGHIPLPVEFKYMLDIQFNIVMQQVNNNLA